jgi:hypothetical protein
MSMRFAEVTQDRQARGPLGGAPPRLGIEPRTPARVAVRIVAKARKHAFAGSFVWYSRWRAVAVPWRDVRIPADLHRFAVSGHRSAGGALRTQTSGLLTVFDRIGSDPMSGPGVS